ncbi:ureidoglycolate lyase [Acidiphilium acidophilum]|uniref:Ureidoglycolate lyase n=1 Tax=Acidiphilium acidophilum TaxID=76588 RepID=A0AAW9DMM5_ACIAO|nr:ureidoglycolate lyase [Acidiphilium acidophilum]MDX5930171.1 ureidoglycolate lyase [Acidiphilium acidophilum]
MSRIVARPLTREGFAPFGEVIDPAGAAHYLINGGQCERYHALATAEAIGPEARVVISVARSQPYALPLALGMVERHPLGSQAFIPLSPRPFLVVVCHDGAAGPAMPQAFITAPGQGINYRRNTWHGVLTPVGAVQDFIIVDRGGAGINLEEFHFPQSYEIDLPSDFAG